MSWLENIETTDHLKEAATKVSHSSWDDPPEIPLLGKDEVHVWRAALDAKASDVQRLQQVLSEDEQARAGRFYFQKDREHFIIARGLLRAILGRYLKLDPSQLQFRYTPHGKPFLDIETDRDELRFNVSHSHGIALYAITLKKELGVDVEWIRPDFANEQIAEHFFSHREVAALRALPASKQTEAFFNCWTRKEAYIKARGEGLSLPLDQFNVSLSPGEPARLLSTDGDPQEALRWSLQSLFPGSGYVAALAVAGHGWRLKCWQWPD